ncbi:MAG: VOC family protein [Chloroflexi bacterium]|nr:VOC family protein [Chloroflexota bacterium]
MGKLRHIAISTKDPEKTAEFYKQAFDMREVGRTDSHLAKGVYLSDGVMNMAILNFKTDQLGKGMDYVGLHHLGFLIENHDETDQKLAELGAECMQEKPKEPTSFFEVKHRGPDGVVIDTTECPWLGVGALD